jgi:ABC-type transport system substrate-binding protein
MGKRMKLIAAAAAAVLLAAGAGCAPEGAGGPSGSSAKQTLNVFMYQKPAGVFSPITGASGPDNEVMSLIYQSLVQADAKGTLQPILAESLPEVSADAKTFTFHLRKDVKWSDGKPFTAKDVVFTYTRAADPKTGSANAGNYTGIVGAEEFLAGKAKTISGLSAPDDHTFVLRTTQPNVGIVAQIGTVYVMPEHQLASLPVDNFALNKYWNAPKLAIGPYEFVENKVDQYVHVTANPQYRKKIQIKDVYLKAVTADVATAQLSTGEMDIASIAPTDLAAVQGQPNVKVSTVDTGGFVRMSWNQDQQRFKDPKVRQAFLHAIDREAIVKSALAGKGKVRNSVFDPKWTAADIDTYAYDPGKARQLLKDAGWDSSQVVKISWIAGGNPDRDAAATAIQDMLNKAGIKAKLDQVQAAFFTDAYQNPLKYDLTLFGGGNYSIDSWSTHVVTGCDQWVPDHGGNVGHYCNKELDALMNKANGTVDEAQRGELYEQASKLENADPSMMWLYNPSGVWAVNAKLSGFEGLDPNGAGWWMPENWKFTS